MEFRANSRLPLPSVYNIVVRLLSRLPESSPAVNITRLDLKTDYNHREYDSGIIFSLDVATRLAFRDEASIVEIGGPLTAALQSIVIDAKNYHSLAISHAISYLFELLRRSNVCIPIIRSSCRGLYEFWPVLTETITSRAMNSFAHPLFYTPLQHWSAISLGHIPGPS